MEKQKRWQFYLIVTVLILTLYNILPTIFYYSKPLGSPIDQPRAEKIAGEIVDRVNALEDQAKNWIASYANLLKLDVKSIEGREKNPGVIQVEFKSEEQAALFKKMLPKAGSLIGFVPAQLSLYPEESSDKKIVFVERQIGIRLDKAQSKDLFQFVAKEKEGRFTDEYKTVVFDRAENLANTLGGTSFQAELAEAITENPTEPALDNATLLLAQNIKEMDSTFKAMPELQKRFYSSFQKSAKTDEALASKLISRFESTKARLAKTLDAKQKDGAKTLDREQALSVISQEINTLEKAIAIVKKDKDLFKSAKAPFKESEIRASLDSGYRSVTKENPLQLIKLEGRNPLVEAVVIDWSEGKISLKLYSDIAKARQAVVTSEASGIQKESINQFIVNEMARVSRKADETLLPDDDTFALNISSLPGASSFLKFDLKALAAKQAEEIKAGLESAFHPESVDLKRENYPIRTYAEYKKENAASKKLGFVILTPSVENGAEDSALTKGFRRSSIYVVAKGLQSIVDKLEQNPSSQEARLAALDLKSLENLMQSMHFIGYSGASFGFPKEFANDLIFELDDYYSVLIQASREDFDVKGSKQVALLPFTDVEQRIITENKIDDKIQEDLLKWVEAYSTAQVDYDPTTKYLIPAPTENPYWSNFKISFAKYFRGDDRKILKWGLDLSGGKTVRIGLRDHNNQPVTNPDDLKQAVNELYTRINKMGVSERTIRIENNNIVLEFPGSQALSAAELVKASAMYFHIVNEKFSPANPALKDQTNTFLQNVWNEAVVTNRKDIDSIKEIAFRHLGQDTLAEGKARPTSEAARVLYENGLRLADPAKAIASNSFNDTLSTVAMVQGDDFSEWDGQSHPLLFVFNNFALEGASLSNIHVGYDPTEGNNLSFNIKGSYDSKDRRGSPRDDFYAWTSHFSEDKIAGTLLETYSQGRGWRMAVILNGTVISKPALRAALRDSATITGRFTTREVNQLAADLKAGSLTFTPKILSEQNVSAELGKEERVSGIIASLIALLLVIAAMIGYYRFAGVVASVAVLLNILIMWGVLQNLDAALSLPAIAGIVLTIGMAVDANVLVFERVREEFAISGRIATAIQAGYRKAFSAIVDSNITTIIAALILIQFDSGPIKGFAVALIVGILSSMFTALFVTRYFFAGWVQNPEHKALPMARFFERTNFDFLKWSKFAIRLSVVLVVLGIGLLYTERKTILGMDFTGGYGLTVEVGEKEGANYRLEAIDALLKAGVSPRDVQVRELTHPNQLKISLGIGIEEKGQPFYQMPEEVEAGKLAFAYQSNPRLVYVVKALENGGLKIADSELETINANWTLMSGQFSDTMRNHALIALFLALLSVLIYITFRFEFKYAVAAVIGLTHDVLITLGLLALFHALGFQVQIDLQVIGAIMTIIGYSLNDTIIVFDRIREDIRILRKKTFYEIINHALNVTLSRTVMTSGTTLLVLLALVLLGGSSIFAFSLVMTLGVVVGTLSSLFIASPVLLYMHNREEEEKQIEAEKLRT